MTNCDIEQNRETAGKMRLLFAIQQVAGGGGQIVLATIMRHLDQARFQCKAIVGALPGEVIGGLREEERIELRGAGILGMIRQMGRLMKLWKQERPDVVCSIVHRIHYVVSLSMVLSGTNIPLVFWHHTNISGAHRGKRLFAIRRLLSRSIYRRGILHICVSEGIRSDLVQHYGVPEERTAVIHNPFDISHIRELATERVDNPWFSGSIPVIVACGRLSEEKNYPLLLRTVASLMIERPVRLIILGDGNLNNELVSLTHALKIQEHVQFLGYQDNPFPYMARSALLALTSSWEGFGNVIVEAMALGLPAVATDCPSGPAEIIQHGENGMLVSPDDMISLHRTILEVLNDKGLREKLVRGGLLRSEAFDIRNIVPKYERLFEKIIVRSSHSRLSLDEEHGKQFRSAE